MTHENSDVRSGLGLNPSDSYGSLEVNYYSCGFDNLLHSVKLNVVSYVIDSFLSWIYELNDSELT
jgi:energy-converting hydrogenase Eha subunit F